MRLTIDTQKDSHEEIKKAIRMLTALVGEASNSSNEPGSIRNIFEDSSSVFGSSNSSSDSSSNLNSQPSSSASEPSGGIFGFFDNADKQVMQVSEEKKEVSTREDRVTEYY